MYESYDDADNGIYCKMIQKLFEDSSILESLVVHFQLNILFTFLFTFQTHKFLFENLLELLELFNLFQQPKEVEKVLNS